MRDPPSDECPIKTTVHAELCELGVQVALHERLREGRMPRREGRAREAWIVAYICRDG